MDFAITFVREHPPVVANLAAFLLLSTAERGAVRTVLWLVSGTFIGWAMEYSSTQTGFPFGTYAYHRASHPDYIWVATVPLFASLSFAALTYFGYSAARTLLSSLRIEGTTVIRLEPPGLRTSWQVLFLAALLITWMDLVMDPVTHLGRHWFLGDLYHYDPPGIHFDVPLSNYAGWLLTSFSIVLVNQLADRWLSASGNEETPAFDLPFRPLWSIGCQAGTYAMMLSITVYLMMSPQVPAGTPLLGILLSGLLLTTTYVIFVLSMLRRGFGRLKILDGNHR